MTDELLLQVVREGLYLALLVSAPPLLASLCVGLVMGAVQTVTQVHDHTIALVPRILAVLLSLALAGPWIGEQVGQFTQALLQSLPLVH